MIPSQPPRNLSFGFLYLPPYRVQGYSIAGEETFVQVPELDVCFDIGRAPRLALASNYVALSHGHMDHSAGLAYYFSQRHFQGMGEGTILCHMELVEPIRRLMQAWIEVEAQRTPFKVVGVQTQGPAGELEIKNHVFLRAFETDHTVPSLGFAIVEKRNKLKPEYLGLPQEKILQLKQSGAPMTYVQEIPLVAYLGDTGPGSHYMRQDVRTARILITECTFVDHDHAGRARVGKHMHLSDLAEILPSMSNESVVLTHLSRRTHMPQVRDELDRCFSGELRQKIHVLMDNRTNRVRYQQQVEQSHPDYPPAEAAVAEPQE